MPAINVKLYICKNSLQFAPLHRGASQGSTRQEGGKEEGSSNRNTRNDIADESLGQQEEAHLNSLLLDIHVIWGYPHGRLCSKLH